MVLCFFKAMSFNKNIKNISPKWFLNIIHGDGPNETPPARSDTGSWGGENDNNSAPRQSQNGNCHAVKTASPPRIGGGKKRGEEPTRLRLRGVTLPLGGGARQRRFDCDQRDATPWGGENAVAFDVAAGDKFVCIRGLKMILAIFEVLKPSFGVPKPSF